MNLFRKLKKKYKEDPGIVQAVILIIVLALLPVFIKC